MVKKQTASEFAQEQKAEATIKVKTLVRATAVIIFGLVMLGTGWVARSHDNARVTSEANALVEQLSKSASKQ